MSKTSISDHLMMFTVYQKHTAFSHELKGVAQHFGKYTYSLPGSKLDDKIKTTFTSVH